MLFACLLGLSIQGSSRTNSTTLKSESILRFNNDFSFHPNKVDKRTNKLNTSKSSSSKDKPDNPDCLPPSNAAISNISSSNITIGWTGTKATPNGIRYMVRTQHIASDGKVGDWKEYWVFEGKSFNVLDVGEAGIYRVELKRICDGENTTYELSSEWTPVGSVTYNGNSLTESGTCDLLNSFSVALINGPIVIVNWDGPTATIDGPRYIIRYREVGVSDWIEQYIFSGDTYTLTLIPATTFEVEIKLINGGEGFTFTEECQWLSAGQFTTECGECYIPPDPIVEEENEITLPEFNCGDSYNEDPATAGSLLASAEIGDVFTIGGFPIKLKEISGGNGVFTGKGIVPLPFGNKIVYVEFSNVKVNILNKIFEGDVNAVSDIPANFPNLNNVIEGAEICVELPNNTDLDGNGFNNSGQYGVQPPYDGWSPTDSVDLTYDPNGFNVNGINVTTGTIYNQGGCTQAGLDENGQPCTFTNGPYYWLDSTTTTAEGIAYAAQVKDSLKIKVISLLQGIRTGVLDSITSQTTECTTLRTGMEGLLQTLGHERVRVFGGNDKYFNEGMHQYFISAPTPILGMTGRDQNQVDFENKHISLYHCDVSLYDLKHMDTILINELLDPNVDQTVAGLLNLIKGFSAQNVSQYQGDPAAFVTWLLTQLTIQVNLNYSQLYGSTDFEESDLKWAGLTKKSPNSSFIPNEKINPSSFLASMDFDGNIFPESTSISSQDALFQYQQGWEYIGDVHRAHYLDAIIKSRSSRTIAINDPDPNSLLPIEFTKVIASREHTILLDKITFSTQGASLDAYMILEVPSTGDKLVFRALNISFGPTGTQSTSTLHLLTDVQIRLNNAARLTLKGTEDTFISWDCDGFAGMGIDAQIEFCRKYLIPLDQQTLGVMPDPDMVTGQFKTTMPSWGEVIVDIDITPFAIAKYTKIKWQIHDAKLDFSDTQNSSGMVFPPGYESPFVTNGVPSPLWKGFYLGELSVTVSDSLTGVAQQGTGNQNNNNSGTTFSVQNVIIDDMGVSGVFEVSPILDINKGNLGGWAFSIDTMGFEVMANQVKGAGFNGLIHIPIVKSASNETDTIQAADCLRYTAIIQPDDHFLFSVAPAGDDYQVPMWKSDIYFDNSSFIDIEYAGGQFKTKATLTGKINMDGDFGNGKSAKVDSIRFQNVVLSNTAPYFKTGFWSFPDLENELGGFKFSLNDINLKGNSTGTQVDLEFDVLLGLVGDDVGVTAEGGFKLEGEMEMVGTRQKWKYKDFNINTLFLQASFPGVKNVAGQLSFYEEHPTYGSGFRGQVNMEVKGVDAVIGAVAQFGKKPKPNAPTENYKYFFIDAMVNFDEGIGPGALKIKGFGGGVYYHMNRPGNSFASLPQNPTPTITLPSALGQSLSGIIYSPDITKGLGLKATVALATKKDKAFNANASFEILYNSADSDANGVSDIWFYGNFKIMDEINVGAAPLFDAAGGKPQNGSAVSGYIDIHYNFNAKTLDANFEVFANVANVIVGVGDNDRFGWGEFYSGPDKWFLNLGTPSNRNGLKLVVGGATFATLTTYLDLGTGIPEMPPLPPLVTQLTGVGNGFMANESTRATGNGFAFGADLAINTGELDFLIFYAQFQAGIGFDLMMQDYGDAYCAQTGMPLGIGGFYASGQAYAYVQGDIGVKVKIFGQTKKYPILSIGAAAVLQAKLPMPFWAKGTVGGQYSVCGGLVSGSCQFEVEVGESCQIIGGSDPVSDVTVIMAATPMELATEIPTIFTPTVTFNVPVEEVFEMNNLQGTTVSYFVNLDYARLIHNGTLLPGEIKYSSDKTFMEYVPFDMLPANDSIIFEIKVTVQNGNEIINTEERSYTFYTGDGLDNIPADNVVASYPTNGQFNFYKEEYSAHKGYVQLRLGQPDLFQQGGGSSGVSKGFLSLPGGVDNNSDNGDPNGLKAILYQNGQVLSTLPAEYIESSKKIEFSLPPSVLGNKEIYKIEIKYPSEDDPLFVTHFRTSEYNRLSDKINAYEAGAVFTAAGYLRSPSIEPFDKVETRGVDNSDPLIQFTGDIATSSWYNGTVKNLTYAHFPRTHPYKVELLRQVEVLGSPPNKAVFYNAGFSFITEDHYSTNTYPVEWETPLTNKVGIRYQVDKIMAQDLEDIKTQIDFYALNLIDGYDPDMGEPSLSDLMPDYYANAYEYTGDLEMPAGSYKINVKYTLPGTNIITTIKQITFTKN